MWLKIYLRYYVLKDILYMLLVQFLFENLVYFKIIPVSFALDSVATTVDDLNYYDLC